ncbi:hypothetical protein SAMN06298224_0926 [Fibrobacter sp. UWB16]|nr:hypothetical protein SAMN06298224_0926 [Fibrobacter sp. UWB16]
MPRAHPRGVFFCAVTPDLYKYKALRLSYENASIFAAFASVALIPGAPYAISLAGRDHHLVDGVKILSLLLKF